MEAPYVHAHKNMKELANSIMQSFKDPGHVGIMGAHRAPDRFILVLVERHLGELHEK